MGEHTNVESLRKMTQINWFRIGDTFFFSAYRLHSLENELSHHQQFLRKWRFQWEPFTHNFLEFLIKKHVEQYPFDI